MRALLQNTTNTMDVYVERDSIPSTAAWSAYSPDGDEIGNGEGDIDEAAAAVTAYDAAAPNSLTLDSVAGLQVGRRYLLTTPGSGASLVTLSRITGLVATLATPPHIPVIAASSTVSGVAIACTLDATLTATRGRDFRVEVTGTLESGEAFGRRVLFDVVRTLFTAPMTPERAHRYIATNYPAVESLIEPEILSDLARRASQLVTQAIRGNGRYPELQGDDTAFEMAGLHALKGVLIDERIGVGSQDATELQEAHFKAMRRAVRDALDGMMWNDKNDDGAVQRDELTVRSFRLER